MSITSDEVNYLVYRYLQESGFVHSAFTFAYESLITKSSAANADVPPGALITFLQKGLQYIGIEEHLNEDGSERECSKPFALLSPHICQIIPNSASHRTSSASIPNTSRDPGRSGGSTHSRESTKGDIQTESNKESRGSISNHTNEHRKSTNATGPTSTADQQTLFDGGNDTHRSNSYSDANSKRKGLAMEVERHSSPAKKRPAPKPKDVDSESPWDDASSTEAEPRNTNIGEDEDEEEDGVEDKIHKRENSYRISPQHNHQKSTSSDSTGKKRKPSIAMQALATPAMEIPPELVTSFQSHQSEVFMCAWNPHQDILASGSGDSTARIWDMTASNGNPGSSVVLKHSANIGDRNKDVTTLQWDDRGKFLATGSYDGVARVWAIDGSIQKTFSAHNGPIFSLKWNKEGNHLLSGSYDKSAIVWDVLTEKVFQKFEFHTAATLDVDWQDNTTFATCSTDKTIQYCAVGENKPRLTFTGHTDEVNAIKWNPLGTHLASCSDDGTAKLWSPSEESYVQNFCEHTKEIYTIEWSPTGPGSRNPNKQLLLASASFDATVKLWDVERGKSIYTLSRNEESVYSVAFSPSGDYLASGSLAGHLSIWNVKDGALIKTYQGNGDIFEVAWNHHEDKIAACFSTNIVTILDFRL